MALPTSRLGARVRLAAHPSSSSSSRSTTALATACASDTIALPRRRLPTPHSVPTSPQQRRGVSSRASAVGGGSSGYTLRGRGDGEWRKGWQIGGPGGARRGLSDMGPGPGPARELDHLDSMSFVMELKREGLSEKQAEAVTGAMRSVVEHTIRSFTTTHVSRAEMDSALAALRSELTATDNKDITETRTMHDKLTTDVARLNSRLTDEMRRTEASQRLDLNLEKGRMREEAKAQEQQLKEANTKIETEMVSFRDRLEAAKFTSLQWFTGICITVITLVLGFIRIMM